MEDFSACEAKIRASNILQRYDGTHGASAHGLARRLASENAQGSAKCRIPCCEICFMSSFSLEDMREAFGAGGDIRASKTTMYIMEKVHMGRNRRNDEFRVRGDFNQNCFWRKAIAQAFSWKSLKKSSTVVSLWMEENLMLKLSALDSQQLKRLTGISSTSIAQWCTTVLKIIHFNSRGILYHSFQAILYH